MRVGPRALGALLVACLMLGAPVAVAQVSPAPRIEHRGGPTRIAPAPGHAEQKLMDRHAKAHRIARRATSAIIRAVFWVGAMLGALNILMMIFILGLRARLITREKRKKAFLDRWRPLIMQSVMAEPPKKLPAIKGQDEWLLLFSLWNHLHEMLRGDANEKLNAFALRAGLDKVAWDYMEAGAVRKRLIGILTYGNLRKRTAWRPAKAMLEETNPILALAAMRALVRIDPGGAIHLLLPQIAQRTDWSPAKVATILFEAGPEVIAMPIAKAAFDAPQDQAARLIRYLSATHCTQAIPIVGEILHKATDTQLLSACLTMLADPTGLELVRPYLKHPTWYVRVQAATVMGKIGMPGDEEELIELLSDEQWWVRYRAAQALSNLPFLDEEELHRIQQEHPDKYARDILGQVLAEARASAALAA